MVTNESSPSQWRQKCTTQEPSKMVVKYSSLPHRVTKSRSEPCKWTERVCLHQVVFYLLSFKKFYLQVLQFCADCPHYSVRKIPFKIQIVLPLKHCNCFVHTPWRNPAQVIWENRGESCCPSRVLLDTLPCVLGTLRSTETIVCIVLSPGSNAAVDWRIAAWPQMILPVVLLS